jgi:hypothetical protein
VHLSLKFGQNLPAVDSSDTVEACGVSHMTSDGNMLVRVTGDQWRIHKRVVKCEVKFVGKQ